MKKRISVIVAVVIMLFSSITAYAAPKTMPDGQLFDAEFYANTYPDVKAALGTDEAVLYNHYVTCGKNEGRLPYADASAPAATTPAVSYENEEIMAAWAYKYVSQIEATHLNAGTLAINRAFILNRSDIQITDYSKDYKNNIWLFMDRVPIYSHIVVLEYSFVNRVGRTENVSTAVAIDPYRSVLMDQYKVGNTLYEFCGEDSWMDASYGTNLNWDNVLATYNKLGKGTFYRATSNNRYLNYGGLYD